MSNPEVKLNPVAQNYAVHAINPSIRHPLMIEVAAIEGARIQLRHKFILTDGEPPLIGARADFTKDSARQLAIALITLVDHLPDDAPPPSQPILRLRPDKEAWDVPA